MNFPKEWNDFFNEEIEKDYFQKLLKFINEEYESSIVYPSKKDLFKIFELIKPDDIKVVILGQDPYHGFNQANGIAFSTYDSKTPRSLMNIFKELKSDLNIDHTDNNDLSVWVEQGVFLLNTLLTVREHKPLSHQHKGWEEFTINLLNYLAEKNTDIIFYAFGNNAYKMYSKINNRQNINIIKTGHPSPFSYEKYFKGTKPFSRINETLIKLNKKPIDWSK